MEPDCLGWRSCAVPEGLPRIRPHGFALTRIRGGGGVGILFPDRLHGKPHLKGMTPMETEIYGDERDYEIGGAFYEGRLYVIDDDEDVDFDEVPDED